MSMNSLLLFLKEIDLLKKIERQTLIHTGGRRENSAEHSWHLAMAVMIFRDLSAEAIDLEKALKMALVHDIVEIDAGDTFIYGDLSGKVAAEALALDRIMDLLPPNLGHDLKQIWLEFEERQTPEAKYVAALDKFLPLYSNALNSGYSWKNHQVPASKVHRNIQNPMESAIPLLWKQAEQMIEQAIQSGLLKSEDRKS